jgi:hypothetical protein
MANDNTTTPLGWFIVGMRILGIWQLMNVIGDLVAMIGINADLYRPQYTKPGWYMLAAFGHFALAVWLLKFAPQTARFFYPDKSKPTTENTDTKSSQ